MPPQSGRRTRGTKRPRNEPFPVAKRKEAARRVIDGYCKPKQAAKEVGCSTSAVRGWVQMENTQTTMHEEAHRRSLVSPERKKRILATIEENSKSGVLMSKKKLGDIANKAARETSNEENRPHKNLSKRWLRDFGKENNINEASAEVIDKAHLEAKLDPRHAASFAAMMSYLHTLVRDGLFINIDKTSFDLRKSEQDNAPAVFVGERPQSIKCEDPYAASSKGNCSVYVLAVANDDGKLADIVYLVKDNHVPPDTIDVHPVPMLDPSNGADSTAYLVFVGKFSKNKDAALSWLYPNIVIPFVQKLRTRQGLDAKAPASVTIDGDPRQLQVVTESGLRTTLQASNIILSKSPASGTPLFQPLDAGKVFLAAKTRFRGLCDEGYQPDDPKEVKQLVEVFREHRRKFPQTYKKDKTASVAMGTYFSDLMKCLHTTAAALRDVRLTKLAKESFKVTGISPFDVAVIRDRCKYQWKDGEAAKFITAVPGLATTFARNFELKEKDFEDAGIPANNNDKDRLPVHRRRAMLLFVDHVLADLHKQAE